MAEADPAPVEASPEIARSFRWSAVLIGLRVDLAITIVVGNVMTPGG